MKNILMIGLIGLVAACTVKSGEKDKDKPMTMCSYNYVPESTRLEWKAFKTTDRIGVAGSFDKVLVSGTKVSDNALSVIEDATIDIEVNSLTSGLELRDNRIIKFFFGNLLDSSRISAKVTEISNDNQVIATLKLNGIEKDISIPFTVMGKQLKGSFLLNLNDWEGGKAVSLLNEECFNEHKGSDGVSKLWSEVEVTIYGTLNKKCE